MNISLTLKAKACLLKDTLCTTSSEGGVVDLCWEEDFEALWKEVGKVGRSDDFLVDTSWTYKIMNL